MRRLGIDIGSRFYSSVVLDGDDQILWADYREIQGDLAGCFARTRQRLEDAPCERVGISASVAAAADVLDSNLCTIRGAQVLLPGCCQVIAVGAQSFALLCFDASGTYQEHLGNPPCAAGTGSFLEQQAERLNLSPAQLAELAQAYTGPIPTIATRCAVFAKSDIIHRMQEGFGVEAICAGLCAGVGRSIVEALVKGRQLSPPVGVVGGVACNAKVVAAIGAALDLPVVVPERPWAAAAIGAALLGTRSRLPDAIEALLQRPQRETRAPLIAHPLRLVAAPPPRRVGDVEVSLASAATLAAYQDATLGIDVGSTSTKAALLDAAGALLVGLYTATRGEPLQAVQKLLLTLEAVLPGWRAKLRQAATTGSGRALVRRVFAADLELDEITAHATAAAFSYPEVDTLIEIGGQDAKFTRIHNGAVVHATMNYVCAAGTGSFIEEQARRLGVPLEAVSGLALGQVAPYTSDRCTVYMERDLNELSAQGWSRDAILAGVLFSVRDNYLAKVVGHQPMGQHVVFQGATARNAALVAAFEQYLGRTIHVPEACHLAGALGCALVARQQPAAESSLQVSLAPLGVALEGCTLCSNRCVLSVVRGPTGDLSWGAKCGREAGEGRRPVTKAASPFAQRHRRRPRPAPAAAPRGRLGLVEVLYHHRYASLWEDVLGRLGFETVRAGQAKAHLRAGKGLVDSDFCAPMILAHGAIEALGAAGVDAIFFPTLINDVEADAPPRQAFRDKTQESYFCYYSQYAPTIIAKAGALRLDAPVLSPRLALRHDAPEAMADAICSALQGPFAEVSREEVQSAFGGAWAAFAEAEAARLRAVPPLPEEGLAVVLLGRPYVVFEEALNLGLPALLEAQGVRLYWQDEIAVDAADRAQLGSTLEKMHWSYGKKILGAAQVAARTPNLFVVYLSCFRCSPDAFVMSFVKEIMAATGKPYLILQMDEHASAVGYQTRIEAALRSFATHCARPVPVPARPTIAPRPRPLEAGDTVLVPYISRLLSAFWAECFRSEGYGAALLENDERILQTGYRYANGGECMPAVAIAGGVIEHLRRHPELAPERAYLYLPTLCMACNFPQFPAMARLAIEAAGITGVKLGEQNLLNPGGALPGNLGVRLFESSLVAGLIYKLYHRSRAYACDPREAEAAFVEAEARMALAFRGEGGVLAAFKEVVQRFREVPMHARAALRKPRVAVLGDIYVKYNEVVNQGLAELIHSHGAELVIPSMSDLSFHFLDVDIRAGLTRPEAATTLARFEARYEKVAADLLGDDVEPPWSACAALLEARNIAPELAGETSVNVGRALYMLEHRQVDAIVHVNPIFCCPGVLSSSLFRRLQQDYGVPIVDIFYDGSGEPNRVLVPHLTFLRAGSSPGR